MIGKTFIQVVRLDKATLLRVVDFVMVGRLMAFGGSLSLRLIMTHTTDFDTPVEDDTLYLKGEDDNV